MEIINNYIRPIISFGNNIVSAGIEMIASAAQFFSSPPPVDPPNLVPLTDAIQMEIDTKPSRDSFPRPNKTI